MKLSSLVKNTGLLVAITFAGQTNAALMGSFSGTISAINPWVNATSGNLAADIAADSNSPFDMSTLFTGNFALNDGDIDSNSSPSVGSYSNAVQSFSISGGDINSSASNGSVKITNDKVVGSGVKDEFKLDALGIDDIFVINGNSWIFRSVHIILDETGSETSDILTSDSLNQHIPAATQWKNDVVVLRFDLQGVNGGIHFAKLGSHQSEDLTVELLTSQNPAPAPAPVAAPATLPLLLVAMGMLGLRRRS